jgi:hypothetical protein
MSCERSSADGRHSKNLINSVIGVRIFWCEETMPEPEDSIHIIKHTNIRGIIPGIQ